jgi:nucleoside-diphosphate-sugar epimerase
MRLAITGGSGFIGTNAVDLALERGIEVLNLDIRPPKKTEHQNLWKEIDLRDREAMERELTAFDPTHILHLAAKTGMDVPKMSAFAANTDGVSYLIEISRQLPSLKRVLFTSTLIVTRYGVVPTSDTHYDPSSLYGESKAEGERIVRAARDLPFSWVIIRPSSIWGPWFEMAPYGQFFQTISRGHYFHSSGPPIYKPLCYVGNAVYMLFNILEAPNEKVDGKTVWLLDYPNYSTREWGDEIQRLVGARRIPVVPHAFLRLLALGGDVLLLFLPRERIPLTSFRLRNMTTRVEYPSDKTEAIVGPLPYSFGDGSERTVEWMAQEGFLKRRKRTV